MSEISSSDKIQAIKVGSPDVLGDSVMLTKLTLLLSALGALRDVVETLLVELEAAQQAELAAKQRARLEARIRTGSVLFVSLLNVILLVLVLLK